MAEYYSGRVHTLVYDDPSKAFYIMKMKLEDSREESIPIFGYMPEESPLVSVKGYIPGLHIKPGTWFGFEGTWTNHPKYGRQLNITKAPVLKGSWNPSQAAEMLKANGVGEQIVELIQKKYPGEKFLDALTSLEKLRKVKGLAKQSVEHVIGRWKYVTAYFRTLEFISQQGLPSGKVSSVWAHFGDDAIDVLSTNPWRLVEIEGITFDHADNIAKRLNLDLQCLDRVRGAVLYSCMNQKSMGHMYLTAGQVFQQVRLLCPETTLQEVAEGLRELHKKGHTIVDKTTKQGVMAVYDPWSFLMEDESSRLIVERVKTACIESKKDRMEKYTESLVRYGERVEALWNEAQVHDAPLSLAELCMETVEDWSETAHLHLSENQKKGVINALCHPVSILTGLPGTGKTTSLKAAVQILVDLGENVLLCAPTGIAAKRLSSVTDTKASTIHRAFGAKGSHKDNERESTYAGVVGDSEEKKDRKAGGGIWQYDSGNPHPATVVIVDESSMLDQHLMYRIMSCTAKTCRVVLVGDAAQLPSVGPGNVLRDLIKSDICPVVNLTEIFRQSDTSAIVYAAHAVHRGEIPEITNQGDFALVQVSSEEKVAELISLLAQKMYEKRRDFQILSPRHKGVVGVTSLNTLLRELLNPRAAGTQEHRLGNETLREGDRVMVVKNDYRLGVFNGDVGKINRILARDKALEIKIHGETPTFVQVPFKRALGLLRLAYACTVHKSQGLEYDTIIIPVVDSFRHQLQRNLYYTAITRARQRVILIGTVSAFKAAVWNAKEDSRNTLFKDRIWKYLENFEDPRSEPPEISVGKPSKEEVFEGAKRFTKSLMG